MATLKWVGALITWPYTAGGRSRRGSPKAGTGTTVYWKCRAWVAIYYCIYISFIIYYGLMNIDCQCQSISFLECISTFRKMENNVIVAALVQLPYPSTCYMATACMSAHIHVRACGGCVRAWVRVYACVRVCVLVCLCLCMFAFRCACFYACVVPWSHANKHSATFNTYYKHI